jgi:hypothetical protein
MKRLFLILAVLVFSTGCAGWQSWEIPDNVNAQAVAYGAGKGVGYAVNKFAPKADAPLGAAWKNMIQSNAGAEVIPAEKVQAFYQEAVALLAQESKDPYGLISDLTFFLSIYGGFIDKETGKLVLAKPIPLIVAKAFELGYRSGKSAVQSYTVRSEVP